MRALWMGYLCILLAPALRAAPAELTPANVEAFFDTAFSVQQQDHEVVGAVVSLVHDGEVLFKAGYGFADLEARTPADPDQSLFRIASISKPFVWTAVMQLVEQGRLSLDDPVDDYLDFAIPATFDEPIRIRHLLTHTPGFEEQGVGSSSRKREDVPALGQHLANAMPARVRPPGVHASYSNYGSALAGYIVERISGESWSDYIDRHILAPLDMTSTNTQLDMSEDHKARHAKGYRYQGGQFEASEYAFLNSLPAGHMSATASDMARFMLAHLNDGALGSVRILEPDTVRKMHSPLFDPHEGIAPMLHGFYRSDRHGLAIFGHGGDVNQFHSDMALVPSEKLGLFVSFNSDPGSAARSSLVNAFFDHFYGPTYLRTPPEPIELDLAQYAGAYNPLRSNYSTFEKFSRLVGTAHVSVQDGALLVAGGSVTRWIPVAPDRFTYAYEDLNLIFERDADGDVSHMVITTPLSTFERLSGVDSPAFQQSLLVFVVFVALLTVTGYGYRGLSRAQGAATLPKRHVQLAWVYALLLLALYGNLIVTLSSDVQEFGYGMPTSAHILMLAMCANVLLGFGVLGCSIAQWQASAGSIAMRLRYATVAVASLANLWFCWYFNVIRYAFQ